MPGRVFNPGEFPYGYNGQRTTDEISGVGNHYTAEFWEYDPRALHRWNTDPVVSPSESPYVINHNNPIWYSDPNGDTPEGGGGDPPQIAPVERREITNAGNAIPNFLYNVGVAANNMVAGTLNSAMNIALSAWHVDYSGAVPAVNNTLNSLSTIPTWSESKASIANVQNWENGVAGFAAFYAGGGTKLLTTTEDAVVSTVSKVNQTAKAEVSNVVKNVMNDGKNSITVGDTKTMTRYDLAGKAHGNVETPHKIVYEYHHRPGEPTLGKWKETTKNPAPMSWSDIVKAAQKKQ